LLLSIPAVIVTFSRAGFLTLCAIAIASLFASSGGGDTSGGDLACHLRRHVVSASGYLIGYLNTITDIEADQTGIRVVAPPTDH
jgi:hypothetical protein